MLRAKLAADGDEWQVQQFDEAVAKSETPRELEVRIELIRIREMGSTFQFLWQWHVHGLDLFVGRDGDVWIRYMRSTPNVDVPAPADWTKAQRAALVAALQWAQEDA